MHDDLHAQITQKLGGWRWEEEVALWRDQALLCAAHPERGRGERPMPIEVELLQGCPYAFERCPRCSAPFSQCLRGQVQRSKRFLWVLWPQPYCAVICGMCRHVVGWESPSHYGYKHGDTS